MVGWASEVFVKPRVPWIRTVLMALPSPSPETPSWSSVWLNTFVGLEAGDLILEHLLDQAYPSKWTELYSPACKSMHSAAQFHFPYFFRPLGRFWACSKDSAAS